MNQQHDLTQPTPRHSQPLRPAQTRTADGSLLPSAFACNLALSPVDASSPLSPTSPSTPDPLALREDAAWYLAQVGDQTDDSSSGDESSSTCSVSGDPDEAGTPLSTPCDAPLSHVRSRSVSCSEDDEDEGYAGDVSDLSDSGDDDTTPIVPGMSNVAVRVLGAAALGHVADARKLLEEARDKVDCEQLSTILQHAVQDDRVTLVHNLLDAGVLPLITTCDSSSSGASLVSLAARHASTEMVTMLQVALGKQSPTTNPSST